MRQLATAGLTLALALGIAACGGDDELSVEGPPLDLKIGDLVPLSGDLSEFGPAGEKAADLAADRINEAVDQTGADHRVSVTHEDSKTDPQTAVRTANEMVEGGAGCLVGPWTSSEAEEVARDVAIPDDALLVSPAAGGDALTLLNDDGLVNRTVPADSEQGKALAKAIAGDLGSADGATVNVAARNDSYGTDIADAFLPAWQGRGGQIGAQVIYDPLQTAETEGTSQTQTTETGSFDSETGTSGTTDSSLSSEASQITDNAPDAIVVADNASGFLSLGPALEESGAWDPAQTWATDRLAGGDFVEELGPELIEGMRGTVPGAPQNWAPASAFDDAYKDSDPKDVRREPLDAHTFDAVVLCYLAAVAAGSTEADPMARELERITAPGGTEYSWEELPEAVAALSRGEDIDYSGASGPIDLDDDGNVTAGVFDVYRYEGGSPKIIGEVQVGKEERPPGEEETGGDQTETEKSETGPETEPRDETAAERARTERTATEPD